MPGEAVNLEDFLDWLRRMGAPERDMAAYRSGATAIIFSAQGRRISSEHVASTLEKCKARGFTEVDLTNLLKIGNYLIRFQAMEGSRSPGGTAGRSPPPREPAPAPAARPEPEGRSARSEPQGPSSISGLVQVLEPGSSRPSGVVPVLPEGSVPRAPEARPSAAAVRRQEVVYDRGLHARSATPVSVPVVTAPPPAKAGQAPDHPERPPQATHQERPPQATHQERPPQATHQERPPQATYQERPPQATHQERPPQATPPPVAVPVPVDDELTPPRRRWPGVAVAATIAAVAGGVGWSWLHRPQTGVVAAAAGTAPPVGRPRLPHGWQYLPGGTAAAGLTTGPVSMVSRGGPGDGRTDLWLAVMPVPAPLGKEPTDQALLSLAQRGHEGGLGWLRGRRLQADTSGCRIAAVGRWRAGVCEGKAAAATRSASVRTYVVLGQARVILAVLVDGTDDDRHASEAEGIVASLSP